MASPEQRMVREFHHALGVVAPDTLTVDGYRGELRISLIEEEAAEFASAVRRRDVAGMVDGLVDLLYVTHGAAIELGVDLEPFFAEVHRANMTKKDGPIREDGKRLKPEGWAPPDIAGLLRRLYGYAQEQREAADD